MYIGADVNIKAAGGNYKNKTPLELSAESNSEIHSLIVDFTNEVKSETASSSKSWFILSFFFLLKPSENILKRK